jgi:hypothetical protein
MANIDFSKLLPEMSKAAQKVLKNKWPEVKGYAESAFEEMRKTLQYISDEFLAGRMTKERAKQQLAIQKRTAMQILLTVEGLGLLAAEEAVNAALDVIKDVINAAVGFPLIEKSKQGS